MTRHHHAMARVLDSPVVRPALGRYRRDLTAAGQQLGSGCVAGLFTDLDALLAIQSKFSADEYKQRVRALE